mmetsp:Transcript_11313/g.42408  ORF Transcript_11313/g.42408 Transcript_11313/m.42408 type:complete len:112 (+) Transcript_11313:1513-1848(+)
MPELHSPTQYSLKAALSDSGHVAHSSQMPEKKLIRHCSSHWELLLNLWHCDELLCLMEMGVMWVWKSSFVCVTGNALKGENGKCRATALRWSPTQYNGADGKSLRNFFGEK